MKILNSKIIKQINSLLSIQNSSISISTATAITATTTTTTTK